MIKLKWSENIKGQAILHIQEALACLERRRLDREARQVEGTNQP